MTEFEKMRNEEFYDFTSEECLASYYRAKHICARLQTMTVEDEDCWLGGGVTVCPGVTIGDRCIIGAGSVVVKDIPSDSIAVGNPCRVIRKL